MTTHYERRGQVAVLQIDNPPINGLGHATRKALLDGLDRALDHARQGRLGRCDGAAEGNA